MIGISFPAQFATFRHESHRALNSSSDRVHESDVLWLPVSFSWQREGLQVDCLDLTSPVLSDVVPDTRTVKIAMCNVLTLPGSTATFCILRIFLLFLSFPCRRIPSGHRKRRERSFTGKWSQEIQTMKYLPVTAASFSWCRGTDGAEGQLE